ncbi:hypothetical protein DFH09DRAFT_416927 [Mycena vulgaris]|nr:hypothetical protein DFH09DRAFT_416927 [Mycena vulgaris]
MTWDELRAIISPLRSLLGFFGQHMGRAIQALLKFTIQNPMICPEPYPWPTICRALARGWLRLLKCADSRLPDPQRISYPYWGRLVRLSPHCSDVLADIRNVSPLIGRSVVCYSYFDIHDVLQWLKGFPQPPLDMIKQWETYKVSNIKPFGSNISTDVLEESWMACLNRMRSVQKSETGSNVPQ